MGLADVVLNGTEESLAAYRLFLGPDADGAWGLPNARLQLAAATDNLVLFGVDDGASAARLLGRRGLSLEQTPHGLRANGLPVGINDSGIQPGAPTGDAGIVDVDHLVLFAANRDHATALFGATLGLDFRLAQGIPGATGPEADAIRQLFFRADQLIVEVVTRPDLSEPISFWGIAWRVIDLESSRQALCDKGFDVSEIRAGRKRGTRVCSVRDRSLVVPTLLIEHDRT